MECGKIFTARNIYRCTDCENVTQLKEDLQTNNVEK